MARKSKEGKGEGSSGGRIETKKSFDAELDALFKTAEAKPASTSIAKTAAPVPNVNGKAVKEADAQASSDDSDSETENVDEDRDDGDADLSSIESDAIISGISQDENESEQEEVEVNGQRIEKGNSEEGEDEDAVPLVHETVLDPSLLLKDSHLTNSNGKSTSKKRKAAHHVEPQEIRDARSLFIGNLPINLTTSKTSTKALKKHLVDCSPYPSLIKIESIRFRSIPFSKPTDDFEARDPDEAEEKYRKRQRSQQYKEKRNQEAEEKGAYLSGSQKRKVAFINQDINEKADSVNAYVTLAPISPRSVDFLMAKESKDVSHLTAPALAALLAACVNGTLFEERHLRADLVVPLLPSDILDTGLSTVKTADGSLLGASAGATSIDNESRKRTIFVGNLDFEAKEEELRGFFESLLTKEMGSPPQVEALDFSDSKVLPLPEARKEEDQVRRLSSWVFGVRIIRDAATQMGKGFGYVRFLSASCVDEIMAIHESEQNAVAAAKAEKAGNADIRRKMKFKGRALRVSRCRVAKGNVTTSAISTVSKNAISTPKRIIIPVPHRSRSSGAPTPGGSSPFLRIEHRRQERPTDSPTRKSKSISSNSTVPNPKPLSSDPLKIARNAQKRADVERQAKRLAKKERKRAELRNGSSGEGDKSKIKLKFGKGSKHAGSSSKNKGSKKSSMSKIGKLAALSIMAILSILIQPTVANNEIANFGPVLCRADEVGHLEDKVARQVSQSWPSLAISSNPTLFSINPISQSEGVWLTLDIDDESPITPLSKDQEREDSSSTTPEALATPSFPLLVSTEYDQALSPRDRWLRNTKNRIRWFFFKRYTFRVTWPPNFPIEVDLKVHTAHSMLREGKIKWTANEKDMRSIQEDDELGGLDVPTWPCPRLYLHLKAKAFGVPIPPRQALQNHKWFHKIMSAITEAYIGPLVSKLPDFKKSEAATPVPIHLVLEPLVLGFIPQTALTLLAVLIPALTFTYIFIVPAVLAKFNSIANEEDHLKTE